MRKHGYKSAVQHRIYKNRSYTVQKERVKSQTD